VYCTACQQNPTEAPFTAPAIQHSAVPHVATGLDHWPIQEAVAHRIAALARLLDPGGREAPPLLPEVAHRKLPGPIDGDPGIVSACFFTIARTSASSFFAS